MYAVQERVNTGAMRRSNGSPVGGNNVDISSDSSMVIIGVQGAVILYSVRSTHEDMRGQPNQVLICVRHAIFVFGRHFYSGETRDRDTCGYRTAATSKRAKLTDYDLVKHHFPSHPFNGFVLLTLSGSFSGVSFPQLQIHIMCSFNNDQSHTTHLLNTYERISITSDALRHPSAYNIIISSGGIEYLLSPSDVSINGPPVISALPAISPNINRGPLAWAHGNSLALLLTPGSPHVTHFHSLFSIYLQTVSRILPLHLDNFSGHFPSFRSSPSINTLRGCNWAGVAVMRPCGFDCSVLVVTGRRGRADGSTAGGYTWERKNNDRGYITYQSTSYWEMLAVRTLDLDADSVAKKWRNFPIHIKGSHSMSVCTR